MVASNPTSGPTKALIRKGSPRALLNQKQPDVETTQYSIIYELVHS